MVKQSSTLKCPKELSLFTNFESFTPLSFKCVGIPYDLKSTLQQTGQLPCLIDILFSLMYSRIGLK